MKEKKTSKIYAKEEIEKIVLEIKKETSEFLEKHIKIYDDHLIIILKSHLYIENCLDQIITLIFPKPKKILERRFAEKVTIFESLNVGTYYWKELIVKLKTINEIRNDFVHDLNKKINKADIKRLTRNLPIDYKKSELKKLIFSLAYIFGILHSIIAINKLFPFCDCISRNFDIFKNDKGFVSQDILGIYPIKEIQKEFDNVLKKSFEES